MAELGSILLRRGTTEERLTFVPLKGEIIYDTTSKTVFVGDGETYGGRSVFNNNIIVSDDGNLKVGENLAIIVGDDGKARSLRLPGGDYDKRPLPTSGSIRFNSSDKTLEFSDGEQWYYLDKSVIDGDVIELHVSLDGTDSRRHGRQRGKSWGTAFRTINSAMRLAEDIVNGSVETEFFVNAEQQSKTVQVLVKVSSGIFEEHLPIKVPENTSIFGAGQRRTTVRPKAGVPSESPWSRLRFWRETSDHPDGYFGYHYLSNPSDEFSTPLDNENIDVFLCNNTNWFHDYTTDRHKSFAFVLDPEGQILTKSPYPHTGASFPKSSYEDDQYAVGFHGGMFADGFTGNQDFRIDSVAGDGLSMVTSGFWRKPNMPTAFYVNGTRYQTDRLEADGTGDDDAVSLLTLNKKFIAEETVQYVNDTYIFEYNEEKCRRDLDIILRNVSYDIVLGTNFLSRLTALSYLRPNSAYVLTDQKPETTGAINYAKGLANTSLTSHSPTQAKNTILFDDIIDTINNGEASTDALYWPLKVYDESKDSARIILEENLNFIKEELVAWINYQVNNNIEPFNNGYTYNETKCRRDTEFLIHATIFDLLYDGNYASKEIGNSYWLGLATQIPGQQTQHAAAFTFLKTIITKVLQNNENINWIDKFQLIVPQELNSNLPDISTDLITKAESLITSVTEVILYGTNYAPLTEYPNFTTLLTNRPPLFKQELQDIITARTQLVTDTTSIINSTIAFINTNYASFTYSEDTCRRDVGLIIDSMNHDLTYGGEVETLKAAKSYFETGSTVIANQEAETIDAINYARDLALNVVNNSVPSYVYQDTIVQVQDSNYQSGPDIENRITYLFGLITNILTNFTSTKAAHDAIELNKTWIQDEVIAFINTTYPTFVYNQTLCRRDTGYIISAISNDLFGGQTRSEEAGRSYYRGVSNLGDPSVAIGVQLTETVAANEYAKTLILAVLNNTLSESPYQSVTSQTLTPDLVVSSTLKTKMTANYDTIIDIMQNGVPATSALPRYKVIINDTTPIPSGLASSSAKMITAGNKSFVATDWTMFGNLGYGVLARNNARIELVSIFTYYCGYTYKAESGSEVRSLNGSSSNGIYALGAEGRNPFEVPVGVTSINESVFVAQADSTITGDNDENDLQIVIRNAVDYSGNPAQFFNVMVADVDHGSPTGVVSYEIGNFQNNTLNIKGSAVGLLADIPDGNNITIRLLQEYNVDTDTDISDLLLGAALIYDDDPNQGYRILEVTVDPNVDLRFKIRTIPSLNHISVVPSNGESIGSTTITINSVNYTASVLENRRLAYKGQIYRITDFNTATNVLTLDRALVDALIQDESVKLSQAPGALGKIFKDFSVVKASNHDMLDVGTGSYEDSNYPRELYGPPTRSPVQSQEVNEVAPGRVFFVSNDQDGNFRVGDYFRVNQGDGSVSFAAAIALSNLDGLGFTRGVTINEFSADSEMTDVSDESVPTEQAVVNYINKRLGQDQGGVNQGSSTIGPGYLALDGSKPMEGPLNMDSNDITNLDELAVTTVNSTNVNTSNLDVTTDATIVGTLNQSGGNVVINAGATGTIAQTGILSISGNTDITGDLDVTGDTTLIGALDVTGDVDITGSLDIDSININASTISVTAADTNLTLQANGTGEIVLDNLVQVNGDLNFTGNIIPDTDNLQDIGDSTHRIRDLYLGPGSLYINNTPVLSQDADGNLQLTTSNDKDFVITTPGTGSVRFSDSAAFDVDLSVVQNLDVNGTATVADLTIEDLTAGRVPYIGTSGAVVDKANLSFNALTDKLTVTGSLTVDNVDIDDNGFLINGNQIYATGSASAGNIFLIPGFNAQALGNVTIQGNLDVTGTTSTTDVGLGNTQINGNFSAFGNTILGNQTTDPITITGSINSNLLPLDDSTHDIGSTGVSAKRWANIYTDNIETDNLTIRRSGDLSMFDSNGSPVEVFSVDGANGNIVSTGTFLSGAATHKGNFKIQTSGGVDKFTVNATTGDTVISGTLTVDNTVTINATTVTVDDPIFTLGGDTNPLSDDNLDRGIEFRYYSGSAKLGFFGLDDSSGKFKFIPDATNVANVFSGTKGTIDANLEWADILNKPDPVITLSGDATGNVTLTNLGNGTLALSLVDESVQDIVGAMVTGNSESGISVTYQDADGTLDFNVSDPTITLTGDVTGSATMTNLGDVSITTSVTNDSHNHDGRYYTETESDTRFVNVAGDTMTGELQVNARLDVGDGSANDTEIRIYKADNNVSDHIQFYNGTTRVGEIGVEDTTWLRINQETNKNIYTPRSFRSDGYMAVQDGMVIGGTALGPHNANGLEIQSTSSEKIVLSGATQPYIRWQETTTDKAYIQWKTDGYLQISNQEDASQLRIKDAIDFSADGTNFNRLFHDGYHPNADAWTTARTLTLSGDATGSVSWDGSADASLTVTVANDSHTHDSRYYTETESDGRYILNGSNDTGTGGYQTTGTFWEIGHNTGGVAMTTNDGYGNANLTFNHRSGVPDINGSSARIETSVDSTTGSFSFEVGNSVSNGVAVSLTQALYITTSQVRVPDTLSLRTTNLTTGASSTTGTVTGRWSLTTGSRFQATYADLAEIYETDFDYEPGTIVMFGGEKEATIACGYATTKVLGIISDTAAFIMNDKAPGQPIALKGRLPVKVKGLISKGDFIVASDEPGVGVSCATYIGGAIVGQAIEEKTTEEIGLIEVKV